MKDSSSAFRLWIHAGLLWVCLIAAVRGGFAQAQVTNDPSSYGPFSAVFLVDGDGLKKPLVKDDSVLRADSPWSLYGWVRPIEALKAPSLVGGMGDPEE